MVSECPFKVGDRVRAHLGTGRVTQGEVIRVERERGEWRLWSHWGRDPAEGLGESYVLASQAELLEQPEVGTCIDAVCGDLAAMLREKNEAYGNSVLEPVRVFSKADAIEQIKVRMDDKLSRLVRGDDAGEDTIRDLVGYWVMWEVAKRMEGK